MNLLELSDDQRQSLLADARSTAVARGDFLYTVGDASDVIFGVESGRVKIVRTTANGHESIVGIRTPGDLFGELAWMGGGRRTTSAIALDPGTVWRIEASRFADHLRAEPELSARFAHGLALRLAAVERELTELAGKSVPGRLVDVLGRLASEYGVFEDGALRIALSLTHQDLADLIGTSRETLTKELGVLADVGLLRVEHRTIILLAPRAFPFGRSRLVASATE